MLLERLCIIFRNKVDMLILFYGKHGRCWFDEQYSSWDERMAKRHSPISHCGILSTSPFRSAPGTRPGKRYRDSLDDHLSSRRTLSLFLAWAPKVMELGSSSRGLNFAQNAAGKPLHPNLESLTN